MRYDELQIRLERISERIALAAQRAGREAKEITLLAATKTVAPERIRLGINLGLQHVGENRVQEAEAKLKALVDLRSASIWHFIGHLQTNKVRRALELFDVIQTVDSHRLARHLERGASEIDRIISIYIEVNIGQESSKSGTSPDQLMALGEVLSQCPHLRLDGLMAVPPYVEDPHLARAFFRKLRELRDLLNQSGLFNYHVGGLSMGMSHDFEVAIEEGATVVRIGTALWGPRPG